MIDEGQTWFVRTHCYASCYASNRPRPAFNKHNPLFYKNKNATSWVAFSRDVICLPFNDHSLAHRFPIDRKLY